MSERYFKNPFCDYDEISHDRDNQLISRDAIIELIKKFIQLIESNIDRKHREDLYVGVAGVAFMFWKLSRCQETKTMYPCLELALKYIRNAKQLSVRKDHSPKSSIAFLCGNAGIAAVSAVISHDMGNQQEMENDIESFLKGLSYCASTKGYDADEVLVGRAGYLHGAYWLNQSIASKQPISNDAIQKICEALIKRGRNIAASLHITTPLMYEYHNKTYLGAAHGICAILHALLESPGFDRDDSGQFRISSTKQADIRNTIDHILALQSNNGNFPTRLDSDRMLVHWCHGCGGTIYLFAKAYLMFEDEKYLQCCKSCADEIWRHGLLHKGPGICHGVAGNGYAFLLMYRLTGETRYLYRASKFAEFLKAEIFAERLLAPDRPYSLYEGLAGTVCFLVDLLHPSNASFPFMDVFDRKCCPEHLK